MDYKKIIYERGIVKLWLPPNYSEPGTHIAPCYQFPNGAICLRLGMTEEETENAAWHELGHLMDGVPLTLVDEHVRQIEHYKNEAKSNRFLMHNIVSKFVEENDYDPTWATPYKLCDVLGLPSTSENIWIAEQEIDYAFWGEY